MTWPIVVLLLCSGLLVGFINTLAGGGSVISLSLFMFLGFSPATANGTNRIPITFQTLTSGLYFFRKKLINFKKALPLGISITLGSVLGAMFASDIDIIFFKRMIGVTLAILLFFMLFKPDMLLTPKKRFEEKKADWKILLLFFAMGLYGGIIYIGLGYLLLATMVGIMGMDITSANIMKNVLVFFFTPFTLLVFIYHHEVIYLYGFIHAIGNSIGAYVASFLSIKKGNGFMRWALIILLSIFVLEYFDIIHLGSVFQRFENLLSTSI